MSDQDAITRLNAALEGRYARALTPEGVLEMLGGGHAVPGAGSARD